MSSMKAKTHNEKLIIEDKIQINIYDGEHEAIIESKNKF